MRKKLISIMLVCIVAASCIFCFASCDKEVQNWWEDKENILMVIEDHRTLPSPTYFEVPIMDRWSQLRYEYDSEHWCELCINSGLPDLAPQPFLMYKGEKKGRITWGDRYICDGDSKEEYSGMFRNKGEYYIAFDMYADGTDEHILVGVGIYVTIV